MGRRAEGWKVIWLRGIAYVRFTHAKTRHTISTGERDPDAAGIEAARLYAETVKDGGKRKSKGVVRSLAPLRETLAEWVASLHGQLDPDTVKTYELYAFKHFAPFFATLGEATDETRLDAYGVARLRVVLRPTVRKERSALHGFLHWCKLEGLISALPPWPELPAKSRGKRAGKQRQKANQLSPEQVEAFIAALPMWSDRKARDTKLLFPVRPRYTLAYETGLRPATLDAVAWEDWKGATLTIADEDDKARFGRNVPLSAIAVDELTRLHAEVGSPKTGLIFGRHDYRIAMTKACVKAGIDLKVAPYDFRHARGTHLVDDGASLSGVAFLLGHTQLTTTNKYSKGTQRAAEQALLKGAPSPVEAGPETGGIVGAVPLGETPCEPTPRARARRPHAAREARARGLFRALVKAAPPAARSPRRSARNAPSGSILETPGDFAVRRRGLEPLRELPHWNLKPGKGSETSGKQACRHFRSNQKDAGKRPESQNSGSQIQNSAFRFRIRSQAPALTQPSAIGTPTKEGNDAHDGAPQTYPAGHESGNKPANLLGGVQATAAELVSASPPGGQAGFIDDGFLDRRAGHRLVNEAGFLGPEADLEAALALCAGVSPSDAADFGSAALTFPNGATVTTFATDDELVGMIGEPKASKATWSGSEGGERSPSDAASDSEGKHARSTVVVHECITGDSPASSSAPAATASPTPSSSPVARVGDLVSGGFNYVPLPGTITVGPPTPPWPWGPARRFRIEGPNVIRLADGPPAIGGAT